MTGYPMMARLESLAAALIPGGGVSVALGSTTAYAPGERRITIEHGLLAHDEAVALGAVSHEIGHALITRYQHYPAPAGTERGLWLLACNAAEDPRVHVFLKRRLPGIQPWLRALFDVEPPPPKGEIVSELVGFLSAMAMEDRYAGLPFLETLPGARSAFRRTAAARRRYATTLPPADLCAEPGAPARWRENPADRSPVAPAISAGSAAIEAGVRHAARAALKVFRTNIWPEILRLIESDTDHVAGVLDQDEDLRRLASCPGLEDSAAASLAVEAMLRRREGGESSEEARTLARRLLEAHWALIQPSLTGHGGAYDSDAPATEGARATETSHAVPREDSAAVDDAGPASEAALRRSLTRALPRPRTRLAGGFRTGAQLDLPSLVQAAATGREPERIWQRKIVTRPARLAVLLLVDCSGSMAGEKGIAAASATRRIASALRHLNRVAFAVFGFQDELIPIIGFGETEADLRSRIGRIPLEIGGRAPDGHNRPSYNDDGPVLREAAEALFARPEQRKLLIVVSDGRPEGRRSDEADLHTAVAAVSALPGLTLVGLGLGPNTEHVTEFYPRAEACVAPAALAQVIERLLARSLRDTRSPRVPITSGVRIPKRPR
ncbi:MAG: hypothetical protein ACLPWS_01105 [Rhodomicrobium sp.]